MVHPVWYIVTFGVAIGTALFAYYNIERPQEHRRRPTNSFYTDYPSDGGDSQRSTCSICLNTMPSQHIRRLKCGHCFHTNCIDKWLESSSYLAHTCPNCRERIS